MPSVPTIVVGGGIAGVACARMIAEAGLPVRVVDRGRRLGGRMAVRTVDEHAIDLGASYFTVQDDAFAAVAADWQRRGLARVWTDRFHVADADGLGETKTGPGRWAATTGLRSLVEDLAAGLTVERRTVQAVGPGRVDDEPAACVVLAMPDPQARRLVGSADPEALAAAGNDWEPSLALAARWPKRSWPQLDGAFVHGLPAVRWIADDGRRRGDDAPVLVAHSTPDFARAHLVDPDAAAPAMLAEVRQVLGIADEPAWSTVQRWAYSQPATARETPYFLSTSGIGLCGDGWSSPSRVEAAYLSGRALGTAVAERLSD